MINQNNEIIFTFCNNRGYDLKPCLLTKILDIAASSSISCTCKICIKNQLKM